MTETPPSPPGPRLLRRAKDDRVLGGVCAGAGRYVGIDAALVRVAAVLLAAFGGAGILLYFAALLLVPEEGSEAAMHRGRFLTVIGVIMLVLAGGVLLPHARWFPWPFGLLLVGPLAAWIVLAAWVTPGEGREVAARLARVVLLVLACGVLALGGALLAGTGHATLAAVLVIVLGVALTAVGLLGRGDGELLVPALALALPVAVVGAAGIDLRGGVGDRTERPPGAAQVRDLYRLGAGRLVVDLRDARLPAGDRRVHVRVGLGEAVLLVPQNVCVATRADVGAGEAVSFDRNSGGVDVAWRDAPPAPQGRARVVLDADVGLGAVAVANSLSEAETFRTHEEFDPAPTNTGCEAGDVTAR